NSSGQAGHWFTLPARLSRQKTRKSLGTWKIHVVCEWNAWRRLVATRAVLTPCSWCCYGKPDRYCTRRLQPRMSLLSNRPSTSKLPSGYTFPKSWVSIKAHEYRLARSTMFSAPVFPDVSRLNGSLASRAITRNHGGHRKRPAPAE